MPRRPERSRFVRRGARISAQLGHPFDELPDEVLTKDQDGRMPRAQGELVALLTLTAVNRA